MRKALLSVMFLAAAAAAVIQLGGCATEPVTGRKQLMLVSSGEELQLGLTEFEKLKGSVPLSKDAKAQDMVKRVGQRIAAVAELPNAQWEFVLFESAEPNAFCLPGGKVGVYTGILPITQDEAGLATVLGHEVAHAAAHHGAERMSEAMVMSTAGNMASSYLGGSKPDVQPYFDSAYGVGSQVLRALPHSRSQEARADQIGLIYMARAGFDPEAAVGFWQRFAEYNRTHGGNDTVWFLRTHPLDADRIANLKKYLPQAKQEFRPAK
jgi:metalloendopeptidase OMA1, mitochondrial